MTNRKIISYLAILIGYVVMAFLTTGIGAMIMGTADYVLIVVFGLINMCIAHFYFKIESLRSIFIGFLISSSSLVFSYLIWIPISNFNLSDNIIILGILNNAIFQTFSWVIVERQIGKRNKIKTKTLFLSVLSVTIIACNLYDFWKFEEYYNWNETKKIAIKITDSKTGKAVIGDSIRLTADRQSLFGLMATSKIGETVTDKNGLSEFKVYFGNEYQGRIWRNNGHFDFFEVSSNDITKKDTIEIKTTANTVYN
jgi:hypothetical protein